MILPLLPFFFNCFGMPARNAGASKKSAAYDRLFFFASYQFLLRFLAASDFFFLFTEGFS